MNDLLRLTRTAVIVSGAGAYADARHDFDATSAAVAGILAGQGFSVAVRPDVDAVLASMADPAERPDLLLLNIGDSGQDPPQDAAGGLIAYVGTGGPVLAMHASATAFPS